MSCKNTCKMCDKLISVNSISFTAGTGSNPGTLVINLQAGSYNNNCKYCILIDKNFPIATTRLANVVFTIGTGTQQYPLVNRCCHPVTACGIHERHKYSICVETTATGAVFKMLGTPFCQPNNNLRAVNGTAPVAEPATPEVGA